MRRFRVAYVFGFAAYPVLFLFAHNVDRAVPADVVAPLSIALGASAVALVAVRALVRDLDAAAVVVAGSALLFLSYGPVHLRATRISVGGMIVGRDRVLVPLWIVGVVALVVVAARFKPTMRQLAPVLNVVAVGLVSLPVVSTVRFALESPRVRVAQGQAVDVISKPDGALPDVYYLVFDRYASARTLAEFYDFDNGPFLDELRSKDFRVMEDSRANYPKTPHSLAASLNMRYLDDLPERSHDWNIVTSLLRGSRVAKTFQRLGYTYVFVGSGYRPLCADPDADVNRSFRSCNEFARLVQESTALWPLARHLGIEGLDTRREAWQRTKFQFDALLEVPDDERPTFTVAHFLLPHDPWLFEPDGTFVDENAAAAKSWDEGYLDQLRYANSRIAEVVDRLLDAPPAKLPVVILQSDEGPGPIGWNAHTPEHYDWTSAPQRALDEKFRILNAYHLPGAEGEVVYEGITPVNTFRTLLDAYFDTDLGRLPDESYIFPNELEPYRFMPVTDRITPAR